MLIRLTPPRTKGTWMTSRRFRSRSDGLTGGASTGLWTEERLNQRSPAGRRVPLASAGGWWSKPDKQKGLYGAYAPLRGRHLSQKARDAHCGVGTVPPRPLRWIACASAMTRTSC